MVLAAFIIRGGIALIKPGSMLLSSMNQFKSRHNNNKIIIINNIVIRVRVNDRE